MFTNQQKNTKLHAKDSPRHDVHVSGKLFEISLVSHCVLTITQEFTGQIMLHGDFSSAFTDGSNAKVLPTESQKNTLYALSKKYPVDPLERWVVLAARDIMARHQQIDKIDLEMVRAPWHRVEVAGKPHNHTFVKGADGHYFVRALGITRTGKVEIVSGFKGLRIMKTTQSGFEGFIVDKYTTLKPTNDRIMCTDIFCEYRFVDGVDLDKTPFTDIHNTIKKVTVETFAGPADKGVYSASVQQTIHQIGKVVLDRFPVIRSIKFALPNIHFYPVEFGDFQDPSLVNNKEVFLTFEGAHGQIEAEIVRPGSSKL